MEKRRFYIVDVFAEEKYAGNQLAVVRDASGLSDVDMQRIARETNFSETTFILSEEPKQGGFDVRIFTPDVELPFAGHPTLGTAFVLRNEVLTGKENEVKLNYSIGQITVTFRPEEACSTWMKQKTPTFGPVYDGASVSDVLGLAESDMDDRFQAQEVSTGVPAVIAPLTNLAAVKAIKMNVDKLAALTKDSATVGIIAFAPDTEDRKNQIHARFFTTMPGVPEDPATGSANGCLAGYLVEHRFFGEETIDVRVEQGYEMGRPSLLFLKAGRGPEGIDVNVGGNVVMVASGFLH
jgi:trans-2,3-dihydro-3-hydroxyanthranilate isomerase